MKKLVRIIGLLIAGVLLLAAIGALYVSFKGIPKYEPGTITFEHTNTPENIIRGKKLTLTLCAGCHMDRETGKLTGTQMLDAPPEFGTIYSANITRDNTYGIGEWTDGELVYLLRTGIKRDGTYAPPYMAKLPQMADEDINAIIAFLRSDDPVITADPTPDQLPEPSFLTKFLCQTVFKPLPYPQKPIPMPDSSNTVELGKYLAHNLECFSCHSADFTTNDFLDPEKSKGYFGGGNKPLNLERQVMVTPNLTPDEETGIGAWSREKFIQAVRYGLKEGERALQYPMQPYVHLTDTEAGAIYDYLQTIPPIKNKVLRSNYSKL